jgi:AraC-like DNA-binding protein/mannose-6-phosphate isomerase-like protein (cupin superfamily)
MDAYRCPQNVFGDGEEKIVYDSPSFPLYFREGKISSFYERKALPHYHADFEYIKINSGELGYEVNGKRYLLKKGEGLFVNAMALHYGYGIGEEECDFLCLIFPSYLLANCPEIEERLLAPYLEKESAILLKEGSEALNVFDRLWKEKKSTQDPLAYSALLFILWQKTIPLFSKGMVAAPSASLGLVKTALAYLKDHYSEQISSSSFSKALSVSPSFLTKLFRNYLHDSPMDYLSNYRLRLAKTKLLQSDEQIKNIADEVGYGSANFFTRSFKKKYGLSPKAYRLAKGGEETKELAL